MSSSPSSSKSLLRTSSVKSSIFSSLISVVVGGSVVFPGAVIPSVGCHCNSRDNPSLSLARRCCRCRAGVLQPQKVSWMLKLALSHCLSLPFGEKIGGFQ